MKCEKCKKEVKKFGISECVCGHFNFNKRPKTQKIDYDNSFAHSMSDLSINIKMR